MLSGKIITDIGKPSFSIYSAHESYVEIGSLETEEVYAHFVTEKDASKTSISSAYWGQTASPQKYAAIKKEILDWSLQSLVIERSKKDDRVTVQRNHQAECGLYLLAKQNTLYLHWDPVELYQHINTSSDFLDIGATLSRLELDLRYSAHTPFKDIFRLLERGIAVFANQELTIQKPDHIDPPQAVPLKSGVDAVSVFHDLVRNAISRWPIIPDQTASILSSGLDTTIVACLLGQALGDHKLKTFGYNCLDKYRAEINAMRQETIEKLDLLDHHPRVEELFHQAYNLNNTYLRWPMESQTTFLEQGLAHLMSQEGVTLAFTGIGGDELCMLSPRERAEMKLPENRTSAGDDNHSHDGFSLLVPKFKDYTISSKEMDWPNGYIGYSAPDMANATGLPYLRKGIWYAHPLANAEIQMFTNFLPKEYRYRRRLSREALSRLGWSEFFVKQTPKEGLTGTITTVLYNIDWDSIFKESVLFDYGFIDRQSLFAGIELFKKTLSVNVGVKILMTLELEMGLKSLMKQK